MHQLFAEFDLNISWSKLLKRTRRVFLFPLYHSRQAVVATFRSHFIRAGLIMYDYRVPRIALLAALPPLRYTSHIHLSRELFSPAATVV